MWDKVVLLTLYCQLYNTLLRKNTWESRAEIGPKPSGLSLITRWNWKHAFWLDVYIKTKPRMCCLTTVIKAFLNNSIYWFSIIKHCVRFPRHLRKYRRPVSLWKSFFPAVNRIKWFSREKKRNGIKLHSVMCGVVTFIYPKAFEMTWMSFHQIIFIGTRPRVLCCYVLPFDYIGPPPKISHRYPTLWLKIVNGNIWFLKGWNEVDPTSHLRYWMYNFSRFPWAGYLTKNFKAILNTLYETGPTYEGQIYRIAWTDIEKTRCMGLGILSSDTLICFC